MPTFYFDLRDADCAFTDACGQSLVDEAKAREVATAMLPQLVIATPSGSDGRDVQVDVRDEQGTVILTARLSMTTERYGSAQENVEGRSETKSRRS